MISHDTLLTEIERPEVRYIVAAFGGDKKYDVRVIARAPEASVHALLGRLLRAEVRPVFVYLFDTGGTGFGPCVEEALRTGDVARDVPGHLYSVVPTFSLEPGVRPVLEADVGTLTYYHYASCSAPACRGVIAVVGDPSNEGTCPECSSAVPATSYLRVLMFAVPADVYSGFESSVGTLG